MIALVPFAVLAGRGAAALRGWHDRAEATRAAAAVLVAAISALLAVLVLERAIDARFAARALAAIAGESVDDSPRAFILAQGVAAGRLGGVAYAMHAVFGAATFGFALAPALLAGRYPLTPSAVVATAIGLCAIGAALGVARAREHAPRTLESQRGVTEGKGVTLPVVTETFSRREGGGSGPRVVVWKDGSGDADGASRSCPGRRGVVVYADRDATMAMVRTHLGMPPSIYTPPS